VTPVTHTLAAAEKVRQIVEREEFVREVVPSLPGKHIYPKDK
jgi:hypothetical protein